ncbi:MAG: hypothetical protein HZA89_17220 [Verrucomicrobia bacterium]|nr:hypothetical protein [Verrucomicrobiota bacterium]
MYYRIPTRTSPLAVKIIVAIVAVIFIAILSIPLWGPPVLTKFYLDNWDSRLASRVVVVKARINDSWPLFAQTTAAKQGE